MDHSRGGQIARGLAAIGCLMVIVIGVPWALVRFVGNPLPSSLPAFDDVLRAVENGDVHSSVLVALLGIVVWCLWLQIALALVSESVAVLRQRPARVVPMSGLAHAWVARLVATIVMAIGAVGAPPVSARVHAVPVVAAAVTTPTPVTAPAPAAAPSVAEPATSLEATAVREYTVQPRDSLWAIAERELGDPLRWREIAAGNEGRTQPDGRVFRSADLIHPGWVLVLPSTAPVAGPTAEPSASVTSSVTVARGESLWGIAERELGDGQRWADLYETNQGVLQADGRALQDPDVIEVGWQLQLPVPAPVAPPAPAPVEPPAPAPVEPPAPAPVSTTNAYVPEPAGSTTPTAPTAVSPPDVTGAAGDEQAPARRAGVLAGATLVAAAALAGVRRLRRRRDRVRTPGRRPTRPTDASATMELHASASARPDRIARLRDAIGAFGASASSAARPLAWFVSADGVDVQLDRVDRTPPPGFVQGATGTQWRREHFDGANGPVIAPTCVSVGEVDGCELFLDLEACGSVAIVGDARAQRAFVDGAALTLREQPLSGVVELLEADTTPDAHALVRAHVASCRAALTTAGVTNTAATRAANDGDWAPIVVLHHGEGDDAAAVSALVEAVGDGGVGAAVVGIDLPAPGWRIEVTDAGAVRVPRLEWVGTRPPVDAAEALLEWVDEAEAESVAEFDTESDGESGVSDMSDERVNEDVLPSVHRLPVDPSPYEEAPFDVEVRLIGDVEVVGGATALDPRSVELIAFLACHPEGCREDRIKTALWPNAAPASSSWTNRVSKVRKGLGVGRDGELRLPHIAPGGRYALGTAVVSDVTRVRARYDAACGQEPRQAMITLTEALAMVRGLPFGAARGYDWAYAHGFVADIEATVVDAAHRLAELCLAAGDALGALRAAETGMRVSPGNEILARDRMTAHDRAGDPDGVEAVMRDLCAVLETDDPEHDVHPDTLECYERLRRRRRTTG